VKNLVGLMAVNRDVIGQAETLDRSDRVVLDMDSSESPVHGQQEGSAYNGHFESVCYHPLFLFNDHGDCLAAKLRPSNVSSADDREELLLPGIDRQQAEGRRVAFRADAASARPNHGRVTTDDFVHGGWKAAGYCLRRFGVEDHFGVLVRRLSYTATVQTLASLRRWAAQEALPIRGGRYRQPHRTRQDARRIPFALKEASRELANAFRVVHPSMVSAPARDEISTGDTSAIGR
jgi:hypothetical protein